MNVTLTTSKWVSRPLALSPGMCFVLPSCFSVRTNATKINVLCTVDCSCVWPSLGAHVSNQIHQQHCGDIQRG